MRGGRDWRRRG